MNGAAVALIVGTAVVLVVLGVMLWRRPGPDARGVTKPPVSQRDDDTGDMEPYPGVDRPGGPGTEGQHVPSPGEVGPGPAPG